MVGLVTLRHNENGDRVADLAGKAFNPTHVRNDPLILCRFFRQKENDKSGHVKNHTINKEARSHGTEG